MNAQYKSLEKNISTYYELICVKRFNKKFFTIMNKNEYAIVLSLSVSTYIALRI